MAEAQDPRRSKFPSRWYLRGAVALLLVPFVLALHRIGVEELVPDRFLGKWFSAYWISGSRLAAVGFMASVILSWGMPRFFGRWWGAWLVAGVFLNFASLVLFVMFDFGGVSRALTTDACSSSPISPIRSCRHWNFGLIEPYELTLARGTLEPKRCAARLTKENGSRKCAIESPETWPEVGCATLGLSKASRCFRCDDAEVGGLDGDDKVTYIRALALVGHGCTDAIYFAGDNATVEDMKKELAAL